jgi:hypothetical protein
MKGNRVMRIILVCGFLFSGVSAGSAFQVGDSSKHLTVIAIGDAGEKNGDQRANGKLIWRMMTGEHDGGAPDVLLFLGDNFYPTGLNTAADEVDSRIDNVLTPFEETMQSLGKAYVHAIPGNHDYYTRNALETSMLFGLISVEAGPYGISDRGNEREQAIADWTYHYNLCGEATFAVASGSKDSVQFVFFDSARLLRTDPSRWGTALRSLEVILQHSAARPNIAWRVLAAHHPFVSLGEHGGFTVWNDEKNTVDYLTACDKDSNAVGWIKNFLDPEDLCTERYRQYTDSLRAAIGRGGVKVHLMLSGHDHSLQLLSYPGHGECSNCPDTYVVSGAGAKSSMVRQSRPPGEFTSFPVKPEARGVSLTGFAQLVFSPADIRIQFFHGRRVEVIDMGGGAKQFFIDRQGVLRTE